MPEERPPRLQCGALSSPSGSRTRKPEARSVDRTKRATARQRQEPARVHKRASDPPPASSLERRGEKPAPPLGGALRLPRPCRRPRLAEVTDHFSFWGPTPGPRRRSSLIVPVRPSVPRRTGSPEISSLVETSRGDDRAPRQLRPTLRAVRPSGWFAVRETLRRRNASDSCSRFPGSPGSSTHRCRCAAVPGRGRSTGL